MKKLLQIDAKKTHFFFIGSILILCVGFFIISCGSEISPQLKIQDKDRGPYAIDFTDCRGTSCQVLVLMNDEIAAYNRIDDRPLTVEAWVKLKPTSTSPETGAIMGRISTITGGAALYIKDDVPKFRIINRDWSDPAITTGTPYTVSSNVSLTDVWTHIAGVLSNTVHSHPSTTSCALNVGNQTPHLDMHVDGVFTGCATTGSQFATSPDSELFTSMGVGVWGDVSGADIEGITSKTPFNGIVDEVRMWGVERTSTEINACMKRELSSDGDCDSTIPASGLVGYMRFNEGQGLSTGDRAGLGSGGKFFLNPDCSSHEWEAGWSTDTPF